MKIVVHNKDWQHPAKTEQAAYESVMRNIKERDFSDYTYLAFPWATLIDMMQNGQKDQHRLLQSLENIRNKTSPSTRTITTCQHIHGLSYMHLFKHLGVTDLFFSHKETHYKGEMGIKCHSFPLFPVQSAPQGFRPKAERKILASFAGSYIASCYRNNIRQHILDLADKDPAIKIVRRNQWHYHDRVYGLQIHKNANAIKPDKLIKERLASLEFKKLMMESYFSLCPSGTGPSSIRLFESICWGCIPVIYAETLDLSCLPSEMRELLPRFPETKDGLRASIEYMKGCSKADILRISDRLVDSRRAVDPENYASIIVTTLKAI